MPNTSLWKYCTPTHCKDFLASLQLFGDTNWSAKQQVACLYALSNHVEEHYQLVKIPKKNGTSRQLYIPDYLLKKVQKNILHRLLDSRTVSSYATAYKKGASLRENAAPHVGKDLILKLDIEDFFGSILFPAIQKAAFPMIYYPPAVSTLLTYLCCYQNHLPQGAPTSAAISNLVMKPFDEYVGKWCSEQAITYTRYCDDMTFSGTFNTRIVTNKIRSYLESLGFCLNESKTKCISSNWQQTVTGLTVNEKVQTTRSYRKKLRQDIYYCIKYGVAAHLSKTQQQGYLTLGMHAEASYLQHLLGQVNYVLQINPEDTLFLTYQETLLRMLRCVSL